MSVNEFNSKLPDSEFKPISFNLYMRQLFVCILAFQHARSIVPFVPYLAMASAIQLASFLDSSSNTIYIQGFKGDALHVDYVI
jgi:hypothetical protein